MSKIEVDKIDPQSGTDLELGTSGDTITIPAGVTFDSSAATNTLPSTVVTTDGSQTLTNKSIATTQLTGTITPSDDTVTNAKIVDSTIALGKLSATGTKDATTFLRGDNTFAEAGGGKVLQVIQGETNTEVGSTSTTYADTGLTAAITPSATSSKILILVQQAFEMQDPGDSTVGGNFRLMRDSTAIYKDGPSFSLFFEIGGADSPRIFNSYPMNYLDSPSSTSSITYKTQSRVYQSGDSLNAQASGADSSIILMEIAG